ncbi:phosphate ABC transporter substrate-binding protein PstS [Asticcacaulis benevestitus]|uniref:phosphate ABC transporter substrate-binding protein PstS n=1 Tax=Asticcacaulis benevestitus TaxID=347481 RepID=UPI0003A2AD5E|nr:phosphate ABC transporter substrate-binding protein PstS [Asticcacaulis benevestitus]
MLKKVLALAFMMSLAACSNPDKPAQSAAKISGAGATFPAPLYTAWAGQYKTTGGAELNYQAIGSGGGIKQIEANTVDFGATDKPLKPEELDKAGLYQFPTVMGGIVPIVNLTGVEPGKLKLTGALLADIFLGKVTKWNDAAIAALNLDVKLPATPITVVHRSDGSGTSFLFTTYLSSQSPEWQSKVGGSDTVEWPVGLGGKGNDGVAAFVKQTEGSIGYVEYAYAKKTGGAYAVLRNKAGQFPAPGGASFAAAAASADWTSAKGNYLLLLDQPGEGTWPITGATFILIHKEQADAGKGAAVLKFFDWAYAKGDGNASELDYVPMPETVKSMVRGQWSAIVAKGKPVYQPSAS